MPALSLHGEVGHGHGHGHVRDVWGRCYLPRPGTFMPNMSDSASMFPGGGRGGMNPKQLAAMMKQMGITMEDIDDVEEVIIRTPREDIVIVEAEVSKMVAKGQGTTWQIAGRETRRPRTQAQAPGPKYTDDDVKLVAEQANVSKEEARKALEATNGETAEAILKLLGDEA